MKAARHSILFFIFLFISSCVTTHDLIETRAVKNSTKKHTKSAVVKNEALLIKTEALHSYPVMPENITPSAIQKTSAVAAPVAQTPAMLFFSQPF